MSTIESAGETAKLGCQHPVNQWDKTIRRFPGVFNRLAKAVCSCLLLLCVTAFAANEESFATLKVGDHIYQNVKVTTKGKSFIIIAHSGGIASIKVSDLPTEALEKLGYIAPKPPKKREKIVAMWAGLAIPKTETVLIKPVETKISQAWQGILSGLKVNLAHPDLKRLAGAGAVLVVAYIFLSYCGMLICQKTGYNPGVWVWVPFVRALPMLRAASMSPWWFITIFVPGLNLLTYILWCLKIVEARNKTVLLAVILMFPLTAWFAMLVLALSNNTPTEASKVRVDMMALEAA